MKQHQPKTFISRAAAMLLTVIVAFAGAQTAGAQTNVSDADDLAEAFDDTNVSVVNVTDNITGVGILPSLDRALTINLNGHTISGDGLHFDVDSDGSLTINGGGQDGSVGNIISGKAYWSAIDNIGTVTLSHLNITTNYDFAIGGPGMLYIGENVSFNGWTQMPFNTPKFNTEGGNYNYDHENPFANVVATVTVGDKTHYFENLGAALAYIVSHPDNDDFSLSGDTYTIYNATDWDAFCNMLEGGESFSGKTVLLGNDITVTRCAGSGAAEDLTANDRPFCGTFDGGGNKLTFKYGSADSPADENNIAPFRYVNNATIQHLHVDGDIYTQHVHAGGIVGMAYGTTNITDCRSSVNIISSITGDGTHGGIMSCSWTGSTTNIEGCLFDGSIQSASGYTTDQCGGFVGWRNATINVSNSLLTADLSTIDNPDGLKYPSATFVRNGNNNTITNCYYTQPFGSPQGKQARTVNAGDGVTVEAVSPVGSPVEDGTYSVSGITAYAKGITRTVDQTTTFYYGLDDDVSLTLSNTATAPTGYQYSGYSPSGGTLDGTTLTMPDADVTVSLGDLAPIDWATVTDGSEEHPYVIYNKDQLDLLATRVNSGTNYSGAYFQLGADIKYDYTDLGETESNYTTIGGEGKPFKGHFDGQNHVVSGIRIYKDGKTDADSYQGLFGYIEGEVEDNAEVKNVILADTRITGPHYISGIVAYVNKCGRIENCHVLSNVTFHAIDIAYSHGGIAGRNDYTITSCTSAARLTTTNGYYCPFYGGIVGYNTGTVSNSLYLGGVIDGSKYVGAIAGLNWEGTVSNSYFTSTTITGKDDNGTVIANANCAAGYNETQNETVGVFNCGLAPQDNADNAPFLALMAARNAALTAVERTTPLSTAIDVTLQGRTLYKDGKWNTLCLPFDVVLEGSPLDGDGVKAMTLNTATSSLSSDGTLTLNFTEATEIPAGTPFIVKWDGDGSTNITNPVFEGVTVSNATNDATVEDVLTFTGTYAPVTIPDGGDKTKLYLGSANKLYYPNAAMTIGTHRAYFQLAEGITAGSAGALARITTFALNFGDDEATGISDATTMPPGGSQPPVWRGASGYTLDGRKLDGQPTAKGLYILGGRKVAIK